MVGVGASRTSISSTSKINVLLPGIGHMSLPIDRRMVHEVVDTLAHLCTDGSTASPVVPRLECPARTNVRLDPGVPPVDGHVRASACGQSGDTA